MIVFFVYTNYDGKQSSKNIFSRNFHLNTKLKKKEVEREWQSQIYVEKIMEFIYIFLFSLEKRNISWSVVSFLLMTDKYHGVILLPEGLIESIPEVYALLQVKFGVLIQDIICLFVSYVTVVKYILSCRLVYCQEVIKHVHIAHLEHPNAY